MGNISANLSRQIRASLVHCLSGEVFQFSKSNKFIVSFINWNKKINEDNNLHEDNTKGSQISFI